MSLATQTNFRFANPFGSAGQTLSFKNNVQSIDHKQLLMLATALLATTLILEPTSKAATEYKVADNAEHSSLAEATIPASQGEASSAMSESLATSAASEVTLLAINSDATRSAITERIEQFGLESFVSVKQAESSGKAEISLRLDLLFGEGESTLSRSGKQALTQLFSWLNSAQTLIINLVARPNTSAEYLRAVTLEELNQSRASAIKTELNAVANQVSVQLILE